MKWEDIPERTRKRILREGKPDGMSWIAFGKKYGVSDKLIRCHVDPEFAETIRRERREWRARHRQPTNHRVESGPERSDIGARLAEIPPDTRSLTGWLMGDPIPNDPRRRHAGEA